VLSRGEGRQGVTVGSCPRPLSPPLEVQCSTSCTHIIHVQCTVHHIHAHVYCVYCTSDSFIKCMHICIYCTYIILYIMYGTTMNYIIYIISCTHAGVNTYGTRGVRYMSVGTPTTGEDSVASPEAGDAGGVKDRVKKSPLYTRTGDRGTSMVRVVSTHSSLTAWLSHWGIR
jgi:hypothetical protein